MIDDISTSRCEPEYGCCDSRAYYVDMDDRSPFQTNALAFPLASLYFARNNSSFGSVSSCQAFREVNKISQLLTRRYGAVFHPYVENGRSFRHSEAAGYSKLLEAVSVLHKLRTALHMWPIGMVVLKTQSLAELQRERECCITH